MSAVGKIITSHIDTTIQMVDIGSPGQTSWDFSAIHADTNYTMTSVQPSSSPYFSTDFPTSNSVFHITGLVDESQANSWEYFTLNSNEYLLDGEAFNYTVDYDYIEQKVVYDPAAIDFKLPLAFSTQWSDTYTGTITLTKNGSLSETVVVDYTETEVVDAWGNLKLPGGAVVQALRIRSDLRSVSSGIRDRTISYSFITKSGTAVSLSAVDTTAANSGMIQTDGNGISWKDISGSNVGIDDAKPAQQFALSQNMPNPSTQNTRIQYSTGSKQFVTLKVYNFLGIKVATLVDELKPAGNYEVSFDASKLAPGNYYYQMRAGNFTAAKKMIVIKQR